MKTNTKTQQAQLFGILNNSYIFVEYVRTVVKSVTSKLNDNKKILNKKILNQESIGFKDLHNVYKSANVKLLKKVSEFLCLSTEFRKKDLVLNINNELGSQYDYLDGTTAFNLNAQIAKILL